MKALVYKNLSDAFDVVDVAAGNAICNIIKTDWEHSIAIVNGKTVTADYIIKEGDIVVIRSVPHGTEEAVWDVFRGIFSFGLYTIIKAGLDAYEAREAAARAQKEIEKMKSRSKDGIVNLPYIKGASNTVATGKTEPYIIGEHLLVPYILNSGGKYQGYSVIGGENGKDQYYVVVLEGGFNKQVLRRLKSDDVTLKTWTGDAPQEGVYQFDAGPFYDAESLVEIAQDGKPFDTSEFNKKIVQQTLNDNLRKSDDEQYESLIYTLEKHSMAADVCILFNGLVAYDDSSNKINRSVTINPCYSLDGGNTWIQFQFNQNGTQSNTFNYRTLNQLRFNAHVDFNFNAVKDLAKPIMIKLDCTTPKYKGSAYDQCYVQWVQSTIYNPDESKTSFVSEKIIGETEAKLSTTIGLKIKSTASNQDKLKKINVITCGTARTWNGVQWSAEKKPTRNPAAWLLEVLTSPTHTPSQCDDSEIDLESFGDLYAFCEREKFTCDMVLTDGEPKENVLQKICQTCNATLYQDIYGKISIVSDSKKENAIAVFNEQNLISFSYEKDLARRTDGIKIKYISRTAEYAEDTCLVMRKGAVRNSESILRDMNVTGITEYAQIVKYARYVMACDELRPKTATARVGKEGIFFTPLAKVLVQHPSLKIGLGSAQIKSVVTDGTNITGLRLYEPITLDTKHNFNVVIQCVSSNYCTPLALSIKRHNGRTKEITLTQPLSLASAVIPHAGDILSYGDKKETVTSPMLITGIQPDNDGYTLTLVDYNEAIYDAGDIPDYTPNITQSGDGTAGTIPAQAVTPDDLANIIGGITGGTAQVGKPDKVRGLAATAEKNGIHIACGIFGVGLANSIKAIIWEIKKTGSEQWQVVATTAERVAFYMFNRDIDGYPEAAALQNYRVRARALNIYGTLGDWSDEKSVSITGYGTWLLQAPAVQQSVSHRFVSLALGQPPRADNKDVYGTITHMVQIRKPATDAANVWYKPATSLDPYISEDNYKEGGGAVTAGTSYTQTLPLTGQNGASPAPQNTLYQFKIIAQNEAGQSAETVINVTATNTNISDIVKGWYFNEQTGEKIKVDGALGAEHIYTEKLSAIAADMGYITGGSFGGNDLNHWALTRVTLPGGKIRYEGSMRVGGVDEYLQVIPIVKNGIVQRYEIKFKVGNFEVTSQSSNINGDLYIQGNEKSLDRTKITPTGMFFEHRITASDKWTVVNQFTTSGIKTPTVYSDNHLIITNKEMAERRKSGSDIGRVLPQGAKVYHYDTDIYDQTGADTLPVIHTPAPEKVAPELRGSDDTAAESSAVQDFTPAILACAPYSTVAKMLYGNFALEKSFGVTNTFTVDFWLKYFWNESQEIFRLGTNNEYVSVKLTNREPYYNEVAAGDVPYNEATAAAQEVVYNEIADAKKQIIYKSAAGETRKDLSFYGVEFLEGEWTHVGIIAQGNTVLVLFDKTKIAFTKNAAFASDVVLSCNKTQGLFCVDEMMIAKDTAITEAQFLQNTEERIPWGSLDYTKKWFVIDADKNIFCNLFESEEFKQAVRKALQP